MANVKISELTALTSPSAADELPVVDVSATSTKKTTIGEVVGIISGDVEVATDGIATISELPISKLADGAARQLIQTDAAGTGVEWTSNVDVPGTLDVTGAATFDAAVTITGDLTVNGTTTNINTQNLVVEDKNIILADVASPTDVTADGGGITLKGATDKTITWSDTTDSWTFNQPTITTGSSTAASFIVSANAGSSRNIGAESASNTTVILQAGSASGIGANIELGRDESMLYDGSFHSFRNTSGSTEYARVDGSGRLLLGASAAVATFGVQPRFQIAGNESYQSNIAYRADAFAPFISIGHSRNATVGSQTILQSGDDFGTLAFVGSDGTGFIRGAQISSQVDGTPGTNDMPGRIVLAVTADGASSPTEALRVTNDRVIAYNQGAPAAVDATATLTVANLKAGIVTSTSAAATDMTLPTGTDTQAGFANTYDNFTFEWSVINTGPSLVRVLAGTAHAIVGSGSVATGTSGRFASRRTAANTFVTYRLS